MDVLLISAFYRLQLIFLMRFANEVLAQHCQDIYTTSLKIAQVVGPESGELSLFHVARFISEEYVLITAAHNW